MSALFAGGWERINAVRTEVFSTPIKQLPEPKRLAIAAHLNDLRDYTDRLEAALDEASRLLAVVTELAKGTTKWEPGCGYVAISEADAFLNEHEGES